jgi:hypothetical protein
VAVAAAEEEVEAEEAEAEEEAEAAEEAAAEEQQGPVAAGATPGEQLAAEAGVVTAREGRARAASVQVVGVSALRGSPAGSVPPVQATGAGDQAVTGAGRTAPEVQPARKSAWSASQVQNGWHGTQGARCRGA